MDQGKGQPMMGGPGSGGMMGMGMTSGKGMGGAPPMQHGAPPPGGIQPGHGIPWLAVNQGKINHKGSMQAELSGKGKGLKGMDQNDPERKRLFDMLVSQGKISIARTAAKTHG